MRNSCSAVIICSLIQICLGLFDVDRCGVVPHLRGDLAIIELLQVEASLEHLLCIALLLVKRVTVQGQLRKLAAVFDALDVFKFIDSIIA